MTDLPAVARHPAVDVLTEQAAVVLQERPIVPLSPWLADAIVTAGRLVQVVTPATSRLTVPLAEALLAVGGRWVVRTGDRYVDGLRHEPLAWTGTAFLPTGPARLERPGPAAGGTVRIDVTVIHPATASLELGRLAELCFGTLTGRGPNGWGTAEPATQPWSRTEVTGYCRRRAPAPSTLVLVGGPAVGLLRVARRPAGVVERLTLTVGSTDAPDLDALDRLAEQLADARSATVRTLLATLQPGRSDTTVEPRFTGRPVPYGLLIGPEPIVEHGAGHALTAPAPQVRLCGPATHPCCWCRLAGPAGTADPATVLADVLQHFGQP